MPHPTQFSGCREAIQLLAEHGFDGLAKVIELLLSAYVQSAPTALAAAPRLTVFPFQMIRPAVKFTSPRTCVIRPPRRLNRRRDELRADIRFAEGFLIDRHCRGGSELFRTRTALSERSVPLFPIVV